MKIGELAKATHTQVETIRYYEREGLLTEPSRTDTNYRIYGKSHVERLVFVRHCRSLDMTLDEIRKLLHFKDNPQENCDGVNMFLDEHINHVEERVKELRKLEKQLKDLRSLCHSTQHTGRCEILKELSQPPEEAPGGNRPGI